MEIKDILSKVDHTLLKVDATFDEIKEICDDGIKYGCASVCIPPSFVKQAADYVKGQIKICTVVGFPNGYNPTEVKCKEAEVLGANGADELDMVINVGDVKSGKFDAVLDEINAVKKAGNGKLLKVIIETCLLTDEEIVKLSHIVSESDADFIKTSTGFSTAGATFAAVKLMADNVSNGTKVKAAGGISSIDDAEKFIELGAQRLGTSRIVKIVKGN